MKKVRVGVVGCGRLSLDAHLPVLLRMTEATVTSLCDSDPAARENASMLIPSASVFSSIDELLASTLADAIVISLPTHVHASAAIAAFAAGVHVYLEKPIAPGIVEGQMVVDAWRASKRVGMIGHNYRFNPLVAKLKNQILAKRVGRVLSVRTRFLTPAPPVSSWRSTRGTGGGALLDLAVHHIDLVRFLLGSEIKSVAARIESVQTEHDVATLELRMQSQADVRIEVGFGESFQDRVEIRGEAGTLWIQRPHGIDVGVAPRDGPIGTFPRIRSLLPTPERIAYFISQRRSPYREPSFALALSAFVKACATDTHGSPDLDDGLAALAGVDAAERSALINGNPVFIK